MPNLPAYAARYARQGFESRVLGRRPIFLTVFVTARCGLNCGHCFYRSELEQGDIHQEMRLAEYERFTTKLPSFPKLILTGGEPFLRADLVDIAALFHDRGGARQITIPTAGAHTDRIVALAERLREGRPELILELQLSIDGVGATHDAIRGKGAFEKLMRTYEALRPLQDASDALRIRFNFTFSAQTQDHFAETWRFVTQTLQNPHFDMVLVRRATADAAYWKPVDLTKYQGAIRLLQDAEMAKARGSALRELLAQRVQVEREIIAEHHAHRRVMSDCQAGTLTAIVSETGEVRPCEILDTSFGNLRDHDYDLARIWGSPAALAHRARIRENRCFCTFETCVRTTMSFQPRWYARMLANYARFKRDGVMPEPGGLHGEPTTPPALHTVAAARE